MAFPKRPAWLAIALLLAACQREPIKVGGVFGLSGRHYGLGLSGRDGATLAIEEINAAGGPGGRRLEFLVLDDQQDPEAARRAVRGLVEQGVVAIVGHMTSAMTEATLPIANQAHLLMVSPTSSASKFQGLDDWLVTLYPSSRRSAAVLLDRLTRVDKVGRLAVVYDLSNRAFTQSWHDHLQEGLAAAGGRVLSVPFTSGAEGSLGELADRALATRPDGVLVVANALDSAALCQQVRKRSASVRLYGTDWGFTQDAIAHGGRALDGAIFTLSVDLEGRSPAFVRFREAYLARFSRAPDFAAVLSYEAVQLLAEGLRRDATREGVRRVILGLGTFRGLQDEIRVDALGDTDRPPFLMTIRDGRVVRLQ